jgi:hypothetical protein
MALFYIFPDTAHVTVGNSQKRCQIVQRYLLQQCWVVGEQLVVAFFGRHGEQVDTVVVYQANLSFDQVVVESMKGLVVGYQRVKIVNAHHPQHTIGNRPNAFREGLAFKKLSKDAVAVLRKAR